MKKKTGKVTVLNPKKRKPTDGTMRNVRAANRKIKELQEEVETLTVLWSQLSARVRKLEGKK